MEDVRDYLDLVRKQRKIEDQQRVDYLFSAINRHHDQAVMPSEGVIRAEIVRRLGLA